LTPDPTSNEADTVVPFPPMTSNGSMIWDCVGCVGEVGGGGVCVEGISVTCADPLLLPLRAVIITTC
jgi:hypothetical protein